MKRQRMNGRHIRCYSCDGHGLFAIENEPKECPDCNGSGVLWIYDRGAIAQYYGGPLIGKANTAEVRK